MEEFLRSWPYQWSSEGQPFRIDFPGSGDNSYCVALFEQDDHPEHVGFVLFNDISLPAPKR